MVETDWAALIAAANRIDELEEALHQIAMSEFDDSDKDASYQWSWCCILARNTLEASS